MQSPAFLSKFEIDLFAFSFIDYNETAVFKRCPLNFKPKLKSLASKANGFNVNLF